VRILHGGRSVFGFVIARSSAPASTLAWAIGRNDCGKRGNTRVIASGLAESAR